MDVAAASAGGSILGRQGILDAYTRGRGQLKIRAKTKLILADLG